MFEAKITTESNFSRFLLIFRSTGISVSHSQTVEWGLKFSTQTHRLKLLQMEKVKEKRFLTINRKKEKGKEKEKEKKERQSQDSHFAVSLFTGPNELSL